MCSNSLYSDIYCGRSIWTTVVPWCWTPSSRSRTRWTPAWHSGGAVGRASVDHVPWILVWIVLIFSGPRHGGEMARKKGQEFYGFYFSSSFEILGACIGPALSNFRPSVGDGAILYFFTSLGPLLGQFLRRKWVSFWSPFQSCEVSRRIRSPSSSSSPGPIPHPPIILMHVISRWREHPGLPFQDRCQQQGHQGLCGLEQKNTSLIILKSEETYSLFLAG